MIVVRKVQTSRQRRGIRRRYEDAARVSANMLRRVAVREPYLRFDSYGH